MLIYKTNCLINCLVLISQTQAGSIDTSAFQSSPSVKTLALQTVKETVQLNPIFYRILERIYPNIFNPNSRLELSGLSYVFLIDDKPLPTTECNLSDMDIERIPMLLAKKMTDVEKLDLSENKNLKLNEEWFKNFFTKLKELSLKNCDLKEGDLEIIANLNSLEKLNISGNKNFKADSLHFIKILNNLNHLDISDCNLDHKALKLIYSNAPKLESLNFSLNNLSNFSFKNRSDFPKFKETLKILKLINCKLTGSDLEKFFIFDNLEYIDLSNNIFSNIDEKIVEKLFNSEVQNSYIPNAKRARLDTEFTNINPKLSYEIYTSKLRAIGLNNCGIKSEMFVSKLFELENLETLRISNNQVKFNFDEILKKKQARILKFWKYHPVA